MINFRVTNLSKYYYLTVLIVINICVINLLREASISITYNGQSIYLAFLPYAWICAHLYILRRESYLPLMLAYIISSILYYRDATFFSSLILTGCLLVPLFISADMLSRFYGRKWCAGYLKKHSVMRLVIMSIVCPLLSKLTMLLIGHDFEQWVNGDIGVYFLTEQYSFNIINMMFLPLSSLAFFPLFYNINKFLFLQGFRRRCLRAFRDEFSFSGCRHFPWVFGVLSVNILFLLLSQSDAYRSYFTGALYPLLLLQFVYGIHKHRLNPVMILWSLTVYMLLTGLSTDNASVPDVNYITSMMSVITVFSLALQYLAITQSGYLASRQRLAFYHTSSPSTGLPNNRALDEYCCLHPAATLCLVDMTNLYLLAKYYGPGIVAQTKQKVAQTLKQRRDLYKGTYDLGNHQLIVVLDDVRPEHTARQLKQNLKALDLSWNHVSLNLNFRLVWSTFQGGIRSDVGAFIHHLAFMTRYSEQTIVNMDDKDRAFSRQILHLQDMVSKINNALHFKNVLLYKQPIQGRNGERYYEILARLELNGEILTPDDFLPVVAEINCCATFDLIVVEKCARYIQHNRLQNIREKLSVNIMPASLNVQDLAENILAIFAQYAIRPDDVIFEITEDQAVLDSENALTSLNRLADAGYQLAIDDFGVRHSNFERLSVLRADILKIDGLFIKNITHDPINHAIVASICRIAQLKNMSVVAEFVETQAQYDYLYAMGVDYFQGYFIDRPALCFREPPVRLSQTVDGDSIHAK